MKFQLEEAIPVLRRTPATLRSLLAGLPEVWVASSGDRDSWHAYDIVGHLVHGEQADWIPRARIILEHGTQKPFEPFDREVQFEDSEGKTLATLLDEFESLRGQNLVRLESWDLSEADLDKKGTHPDFGQVTFGQLLATWTVHDLNHIFQICRVMARNYTDEVGPWIDYLAVLHHP